MEQQQATETNLTETKSTEVTLSEAEAKQAKVAHAKPMWMSMGLFMAFVAMLGAVTAYRAAVAEQDTLRFERRLQQGVMLELVHRQELLSKVSSRARYEHSQGQHKNQADRSRKEARKVAATDPRQAAFLNLQAEEESASVRSLNPYLRYFYVADDPAGFEAAIAKNTALYLREWGFDTVWIDPTDGDGSSSSMWEHLEATVKRNQTKVLHLATAVVLFVLGLASLTFAQLSHDKPKREKVLARFGGLLALVGLIVAMRADPDSWTTFLKFSIGFGVLAVVGTPLARKFHFAAKADCEVVSTRVRPGTSGGAAPEESEDDEPVHPAEVDPALFAGMRLHFAPVAHKFGRFVIYMIAISAVLSALSGFFYSWAAVNSSRKAGEALQNLEDLFKKNSDRVTAWNYMVGRLATAEDYHLRYEAARQRLELAKEAPSLLSQQAAQDQVDQQRKTLQTFKETEPEVDKLMTDDLGPEQDVHFPWKLVVSKGSRDPEKVFAQWTANNEKSLGYQKKATTFLALLTLFAIALYLLGQALGMGRTRDAFILVLFACALVAAGVIGLFIGFADKVMALRPASADCRLPRYSDPAELAAEHYARGMVLLEGSWDDPGEWAKAAKEFGCAAEIRPKFAEANYYFALATIAASTPQLNEGGFVSHISKGALHTVSQAEKHAIDVFLTQQDFAPPDLVGNYGFDTYADGLVKGDRKIVDAGRQATLAAIDLDTNNLATRFNLGVAQLAEGYEKDALETYRQTVTLGEQGKEPFVTDDAAVIGAVIGGAITDLDVFRQYCTGLNDAAYCKRFESTDLPRLKSELVAAAWPSAKGRTLAGSGIKLTDLQLRGSAAGLGWSGHLENLPQGPPGKGQDTLAVLWYAYSPDWKAWRVLPAISVRVEPALYAQGYSRRFRSALRASDARICLQSGTYRAEFYVDGELAGSQEITLKDENLHPEMFPDLDVAICRPPSWRRWQSRDPDAVWIRGFIEDSQNRGVFVFAFFDPQQDGKEVTEQRALRRAQNILHTEGLAPKLGAARPLSDCTGLRGRPGAAMAAFGDGGGASIARAWTTKEGLVNVVAVVDKHLEVTGLVTEAPSQSQAHQDCEILLSATTVHR